MNTFDHIFYLKLKIKNHTVPDDRIDVLRATGNYICINCGIRVLYLNASDKIIYSTSNDNIKNNQELDITCNEFKIKKLLE